VRFNYPLRHYLKNAHEVMALVPEYAYDDTLVLSGYDPQETFLIFVTGQSKERA
jgi:hypothetical protein